MRKNFVLATIVILLVAAAGIAGCSGNEAASPAGSSSASSADGRSSSGASTSIASSTSNGSEDPVNVPEASDVIGEGEWGNLFESLGNDAVAFARRVQGELPQAAYAEWDGVASGTPVEFTEPSQIRALFNALASANVGAEAAEVRTDDYTQFWFVFADGQRFSFFFDSMAVDLPDDGSYALYTVEGNADLDAFAAIAHARTQGDY